MQSVELQFDKTLIALAGFPFGQVTFQTQVKDCIDLDREVTIKFPDNIIRVASSFVQGFFDEWQNAYGVDAIRERVIISSVNEKINDQVFSNLY